MNTKTPPMTRTCDMCDQPARQRDVELVAAFPNVCISVLCQTCGEAEDAEDERKHRAQIERAELTTREALLEIIPPKIRSTDISRKDFNAGLWLRVETWRPSSGKWLGIVGSAGQCKTRCLGLLAAKLILDGHRLMWTTAVEFQERSDDMRSDLKGVHHEAREYFRQCKRAAILVLDDFGKNTWTPTVERNLFSVIDHRSTHYLPILWSANTHPVKIGSSGEISEDRAAPLIGRIIESSRIEKA